MNVELKEIEEIIREDCDDNLAYHPATAARRIYNLFKRRQCPEPTPHQTVAAAYENKRVPTSYEVEIWKDAIDWYKKQIGR